MQEKPLSLDNLD